jgi:hypothetical protein
MEPEVIHFIPGLPLQQDLALEFSCRKGTQLKARDSLTAMGHENLPLDSKHQEGQ